MSIIRQGKLSEILLTIVFLTFTLYYLRRALKGRSQEYRHLPGLDAISDGVDRAVETGRPVLMSMGAYAYLSGLFAAMTISAVNIMRYTYRLCIRKGATPLFVLPHNPEVAPLIDGIYREAAVAEGKPETYKRENVFFFGNDETAYRSGFLNLLGANPPATVVLVGAITGTGDAIALWTTRSVNSLLVGGQARTTHQGETPAWDYCMYLSDVYAGGAILSGDQVMMSSLISADVITLFAVALLGIGLILVLMGLPFVQWTKM